MHEGARHSVLHAEAYPSGLRRKCRLQRPPEQFRPTSITKHTIGGRCSLSQARETPFSLATSTARRYQPAAGGVASQQCRQWFSSRRWARSSSSRGALGPPPPPLRRPGPAMAAAQLGSAAALGPAAAAAANQCGESRDIRPYHERKGCRGMQAVAGCK